MKRLLVTILAVMMCFTSLTVCRVFAEEGEETDELWATSVSYRRMAFTDLMDAGKLKPPDTMPDVKLERSAKGGGIMVSGPYDQLASGKILIDNEFNFDENAVGRITVDGLSDKTFKGAVKIYLDNDTEPAVSIPLRKQMGKKGWTREGEVTSVVLNKDIKGRHSVSIGFDIAGLSEGAPAELLLRSIEFAESSIPVMYFDIDETEGTIEAMNNSDDHDVECYGKVSLLIPDYYKNRSEHTEEELTDMPDMTLEYIRGRGNSTWGTDKKPYKVKFTEKRDLLGMGESKHWVLLANRYDNSLIRNRMTYWITGKHCLDLPYSPKCTPVEVVMNGNYYGSYLLSQQIRVGKNNVNIKELDEKVSDPASDKITGGYLINMNGEDDEDTSIATDRGMYFNIESPDFSDYPETEDADNAKKAQRQYIADYMQSVEDAIYGAGGKNADGKSYEDLMDIDSAIDFWWIQEFSANGDAYGGGSSYLYKPRNGKLFWGPLWDFDYVAWGDLEYYDETRDGFNNTQCKWNEKLKTYPEYLQKIKDRWPDLKKAVTEVVKEGGVLDRYYEETRISEQYDVEKWGFYDDERGGYDEYGGYVGEAPEDEVPPDEDGAGDGESGIPEIRTYRFEVEQLRGWIKRRLDWVSQNIDSLEPSLCKVTFTADGKTIETRTLAFGEEYGELPKAPEKKGRVFDGWYDGGDYKITPSETVFEDCIITAKYIKAGDIDPDSRLFFSGYDVYITYDSYNPEENVYTPDYTIAPVNAAVKIKWSSSAPDVMTVDSDGTVHAQKTGTAVITGKLPGGKTGSYRLTFMTGDKNDIRRVSLNKKTLKIKAGSFTGLRAKASPAPHFDPEYTWISADPKIASVDGYGVVTGRKAGTTYIFLIEDASHAICKCKVTVTPSQASLIRRAKAAKTKVKAAAIGKSSVKISWKKVKGAKKYIVYSSAKKNGKYRKVCTASGSRTSCVRKRLKKGKTLFFKVRPVSRAGKKSVTGKWSNAAKVKVK